MAFKWCCSCVSTQSETEDIKQLYFLQLMLLDVPRDVFIHERTLEELYLDGNKIRDLPRSLFLCHGLKILSISENYMRNVPPAIASLINLQHLDLSKNDLREIPDNIKGCKKLMHINLAANPLEKLPEGFTQLLRLEEVYLTDTQLDFLPANFGRLSKLRILELRANNLNTLPKSIARLTNLERLDIGYNEFSTLPEVIGSLINIKELWIDGNTISSIPELIGNLKKLTNFEASHNQIRSITAEIGECRALEDLLLTNNELKELPHAIGQCEELTILKCDENQLIDLPQEIGNLVNLEELIINQNDLKELPPNIGLLRKVHLINVDDNLLEELPSDIGSCISLTILSVRGNRLREIPAELGHLPQIRVLNLADNFLRNLPVSILNLSQLTALWLSKNQSTPLTTLQQEMDSRTGQTVCVNFMLPQPMESGHERHTNSPRLGRRTTPRKISKESREPLHIQFTNDTELGESSCLLRAPTPHPKELRTMSKKQQIELQKIQNDEETPLLGEMVSPEAKDRLIKEAKVTKPSTVSVSSPTISEVETEAPVRKNDQKHSTVCDEKPSTSTSEPQCNISSSEESLLSMSEQQEGEQQQEPELHQQPPPYHIAAAHSKKAVHFQKPTLEERLKKATLKPRRTPTPTRVKRKVYILPEFDDSDESMFMGNSSPSDQDMTLDLSDSILNDYFEKNVIGELSGSEPIVPEIEMTQLMTDNMEPNEIFRNNNSLNNLTMMEPCIQILDAKISIPTDWIENKIIDMTSKEFANEVALVSPKCIMPIKQDHQNSKPASFQDDPLIKPWTFTQDKPVVSDLVIAPTPQRPASAPFSVTPASKIISPMLSPKSPRSSSTSPARSYSKIPALLPSYLSGTGRRAKSPHGINWPSPLCLDVITSSSLQSSPVMPSSHSISQLPQPGFYSNTHSYHSSKRSSISTQSSSNSRPGSIAPPQNAWNIDTGCNYQNVTNLFMATDHNVNIPTQSSTSSSTSSTKPSANGVESNPSTTELVSIRSPLISKIPLLMPSNSPRLSEHARRISSSFTLGDTGESPVKQTKTWMFGPHKNATVFPVVIQKNPDLGFSITSGLGSPGLTEKKNNEILVNKIYPQGPASSHLLPGDKILEVNGIDFTKVGLDKAIRILKQTGNIVNMMISRNQ